MLALHTVLFIIHILAGSAALVLFWIPIMTKKGQLNHIAFGNHYKTAMYAVAGSGAVMAILVAAWPMLIKGDEITEATNPERAIFQYRLFSAFLFYLSILSFTSTRHGIEVLLVKGRRKAMQQWHYIAPLAMLFLGGFALLYAGYQYQWTLLMVFGGLGITVAFGSLRYCFKPTVKRNEWILEHIGSMIGSGIGAYTAFIAFGGRVLFEGLGNWQIVFWVAPGVIGGVAASKVAKRYKKQMNIETQPDVALS